jgi:hypothetical protein
MKILTIFHLNNRLERKGKNNVKQKNIKLKIQCVYKKMPNELFEYNFLFRIQN